MKGPLADLIVLDLTHARAGPSAVRLLADWGARVIKVEPPITGGLTGARRGSDEQNLHRNKQSICIDLKHPKGLALFYQMAGQADVVVENFKTSVKHRLKVDYDALHTLNPKLIYASISGFGQHGPYAQRGGVDQIVQGMSGLMSITGFPGGEPTRAGIAVSDTTAGMFLAQGILLALLHRVQTGEGQWVHTSLLEGMMAKLDFQAARYTMDGVSPEPQGNDHPYQVPMGTFAAKDKSVNLAAPTQRLWQRFCDALQADALREHPDYQTSAQRRANIKALKRDMEAITTRYTAEELVDRLNEAGVPCGSINTVAEAFADPQVQHLQMAWPATHPELGDVQLLRSPINLSAFPAAGRFDKAAPDPGADSVSVLQEFGIGDKEITALQELGAVR
ncbi:MAG: CaiB/BaiF CoA transferase family protein [Pseudomonadales bacterium]